MSRSSICRVPGALQSAHAQRRLHPRAAAARCISSMRASSSGPFVYGRRLQAQHGHISSANIPTTPTRCSRSASSAAATPTSSGAWSRATCTCSARPRTASCSCSAPTGSAATCCRASSMAARISLTIGLLGVTVSFVLGIVIGGIAGYYGGIFDLVVQRIIEVLQSMPSIPLWLALAAIMPVDLEPAARLFRHHRHSRPARLDRAGAGGALEAAGVARGGLCAGRAADGRQSAAASSAAI